ncbi:transglutaminase family protein cysteine peptidase BTLCP [Methylobacterium sp. 4-46]|uniref:transglutaminase-like cysteine peptidase n=1 Tax=unclassified Methylobacterium TaxID=2615210 RepID=UPI000152C494|nr:MULTISPECIES: transglutaminase-like cysteine peptidase [Methylobacterium]ACA16862.1 transglutaminase family protein cysteine peptidase BTLCP [Methylobacterium sp. 4-46]WFT82553.1 transglutaminase-like cysteine peptidase [Methylobacterium nodulans]
MRVVLVGPGRASGVDRQGLISRCARAAQLGLVGATLLIGGATSQAQTQTLAALPDASAAIERGGSAKPVSAWVEFCQRYPGECAVDVNEPAAITLTPALMKTLVAVNRRVNSRIKPLTDQAHWGVVDRWDFPDDGYGDCEDYQLLKRRMLVERGLPRRALRMTVVIDEIGEGHAVLMVRTDRGDYILDNKTNAILPWQRTGYTYVKREGQEGLAWVSLNGVASPVTTANR